MIEIHQSKPATTGYWLIIMLALLLFGRYGLQALEWFLMKLYEFFIQKYPMPL